MRVVVAIAVILLTLALGAPQAEAETLDCQHPSIPLARLICGDAVLRAVDAEENGIYDTALTASLDKAALREEERAWFAAKILPYNFFVQHQMPVDNAKVAETYHKRGDALRQETLVWRKLRHGVSGASLTTTCLALPMYPHNEGCSVAAYAAIEGAPSLRYQLQSYPQPSAHSAVVIFAATQEQPDTWLPLAVTASQDATLATPQATASPFGTLLTIASNGTAGENDGSALYRLTPESLEDIDDRSWLETLHAHLPDGLTLSPEITADYGKMQAVGTTARSQSSCCAVGGRAVIDLAIDDDRVVIKGVVFGEAQASPGNSQN